ARPPTRQARDALVLRVHGDIQQERVRLVAPEALDQHAGSAGGVDHETDPHDPGAVIVREAERRPIAVERDVGDSMLLEHAYAALLGMTQEDLVELFSQRLKRLGGGGLAGELEIGVALFRAVRSAEARAPLLDESGRRDRVAHAERAENLVGPRQRRCCYVET